MRLPVDALAPEGLWLLLALLPLVLLYVLKIRRQRLRVSSTWLWASARRDLVARSPFQKLIPQVPLFLQAAALLLLALALSGIVSRSTASFTEHVAIVVDTSASMAALDAEGRTRSELAREAARGITGSLLPGSRAMVIEAGREALVKAPLQDDQRRLRAAIDALDFGDVEGDLGAGLALATERLRQEGGTGRIVVITDGALAREDALAPAGLPLDIVKVGDTVDNIGIVRIDVRAGKDPSRKGEQAQVFAMLESFASRPREVFVTARLENTDDVLASRRLRISPGERLPVELGFPLAPGDGGKGLIVDISPKDAFATDDVAYLRLPSTRRLPILLAGSVSPFAARAFASDPDVEVFRAGIEELEADALPHDALLVVEGACPPAKADGVAVLVLNPPEGDCLGVRVGKRQDRPSVTSWAEADPRFRFLTLDDMHIARASILEPDSPTRALVRTKGGPIIADASSPGRDVTIVGFDIGESNWPLQASFVLFARNLAEQTRARRSFGVASDLRIGEPLRLELPKGADTVRVEGPFGFRGEAAVHDGLAVVAGIQRAGLYHVSYQGRRSGSAFVAANLVSSRESDLRDRPLDAPHGEVSVTEGRIPDRYRDWSWIFALLALGFLIADVVWLTRKPKPRRRLGPAKPEIPERRRA